MHNPAMRLDIGLQSSFHESNVQAPTQEPVSAPHLLSCCCMNAAELYTVIQPFDESLRKLRWLHRVETPVTNPQALVSSGSHCEMGVFENH